MADEKESTTVDYSSEDLDLIKDLTSYFNLAPGQIVPEGENVDEDDYEELAHSQEQGELADIEDEGESTEENDEFEAQEPPPQLSSTSNDAELEALLNDDIFAPNATANTDLSSLTEMPQLDDANAENNSNENNKSDALVDDLPTISQDSPEAETDMFELPSLEDEENEQTQGTNTENADQADPLELPDLDDLAQMPVLPEQDEQDASFLSDSLTADDLNFDLDAPLDEDLSAADTQASVLPSATETEAEKKATPVSKDTTTDTLPQETILDDGLDFDLSAPEIPSATADAINDLDSFSQDIDNFNELLSQEKDIPSIADIPNGSTLATAPLVPDDKAALDDLSLPSLDDLPEQEASTSVGTANAAEQNANSEQEEASLTPPALSELSPQKAIAHASKNSAFYTAEDLTDEELAAAQTALKTFPYALRKVFIDTILANRLALADTREIVAELVAGARPEAIKKLLENKLGESINLQKGAETSRTVFSRESYTNAGLERQARLIRRTRYTIVAALLFLLLGNLSYFYLYKPLRYNRLIANGKELIETQNFDKAEEYFKTAVSIYPNRIKAYLQFGEAYKKIGEYQKSFVKLFGDVSLEQNGKAMRYENQELSSADSLWPLLKKVPFVRYANSFSQHNAVLINNIPFRIHSKGAYLLSHLDTSVEDAQTLLALGSFHSNPVKRFKESPYRNNLLAIDYFQRVLTFKTNASFLTRENYANQSIEGIGNVYYQQKDYYRAQNYFEKMIRENPYNPVGQSGVLRSLLKIYQNTNDPRLIIQRHTEIRNNLKIEDKLPFYMLTALAAFYTDLPDDDSLRIQYNVSPFDHTDNKRLKTRSVELLDILFKGTETDVYGNKIEGKYFAEGFYQRGRYYRFTDKEIRMALKQMEYAYLYDPRHFLALADRGEMLLEQNDYSAAIEHFRLALAQMTSEKLELLGARPEDETLLDADFGGVYFDMGKALYLTALKDLGETLDWTRIQETQKYNSTSNYGIQGLSEMLDQTDVYFQKAQDIGVKDKQKRLQLAYYSGWSQYARGNFRKALQYWESIEASNQRNLTNLDLGKANALYRLAQIDPQNRQTHLQAALAYLLFLQNKYNRRAAQIGNPSADIKENVKLFSRIATIENNMGAIYELLGEQQASLQHYWRAVDAAKKINRENEVANLNIQLNFKRASLQGEERLPVILDFVSPIPES